MSEQENHTEENTTLEKVLVTRVELETLIARVELLEEALISLSGKRKLLVTSENRNRI